MAIEDECCYGVSGDGLDFWSHSSAQNHQHQWGGEERGVSVDGVGGGLNWEDTTTATSTTPLATITSTNTSIIGGAVVAPLTFTTASLLQTSAQPPAITPETLRTTASTPDASSNNAETVGSTADNTTTTTTQELLAICDKTAVSSFDSITPSTTPIHTSSIENDIKCFRVQDYFAGVIESVHTSSDIDEDVNMLESDGSLVLSPSSSSVESFDLAMEDDEEECEELCFNDEYGSNGVDNDNTMGSSDDNQTSVVCDVASSNDQVNNVSSSDNSDSNDNDIASSSDIKACVGDTTLECSSNGNNNTTTTSTNSSSSTESVNNETTTTTTESVSNSPNVLDDSDDDSIGDSPSPPAVSNYFPNIEEVETRTGISFERTLNPGASASSSSSDSSSHSSTVGSNVNNHVRDNHHHHHHHHHHHQYNNNSLNTTAQNGLVHGNRNNIITETAQQRNVAIKLMEEDMRSIDDCERRLCRFVLLKTNLHRLRKEVREEKLGAHRRRRNHASPAFLGGITCNVANSTIIPLTRPPSQFLSAAPSDYTPPSTSLVSLPLAGPSSVQQLNPGTTRPREEDDTSGFGSAAKRARFSSPSEEENKENCTTTTTTTTTTAATALATNASCYGSNPHYTTPEGCYNVNYYSCYHHNSHQSYNSANSSAITHYSHNPNYFSSSSFFNNPYVNSYPNYSMSSSSCSTPNMSNSHHSTNNSSNDDYRQSSSDQTQRSSFNNNNTTVSYSNNSTGIANSITNNCVANSIDTAASCSNSNNHNNSVVDSCSSSNNGVSNCVNSSSNSADSCSSNPISTSSISSSSLPVYKTSTEIIIEEIDDQIWRASQASNQSVVSSYSSAASNISSSHSCLNSSYNTTTASAYTAPVISSSYNTANNINQLLQYNNSHESSCSSPSTSPTSSYSGGSYAATCHQQSSQIHSITEQNLSNCNKTLKEVVYHSLIASMDT